MLNRKLSCNIIYAMTTRRFTISNIILYALLFGIIFYIQHIVAIDLEDPFRYFDLTESIVLFFILIGVGAWYFIYEYKARGLKLNFPLAVLLFGFFILYLVITITYPEESIHTIPLFNEEVAEVTILMPINTKVLFIFINFFALLFIYIFLAVLPLKIHSTRQMNPIFYATVLVAMAAFVYSFILEKDLYLNYLNDNYVATKSFTNNSNNYAMILMFGSIAALYLHHTTHKFWWFIFAFFFYIVMFPTYCRTNMASGAVIIGGYCLVKLILTYRKHPYQNSVILFAILFIIGMTIFSYWFYESNGKTFNSKILSKIDIIIEFLTRGDFDSRTILWERVKYLLDQGFWVTGVGFGLFSGIYLQYYSAGYGADTDSPHNAYYQTMGCGGWILLGFLTIAYLYLLWMMIRIFRRHKTLVLFTVFILAGFGFHFYTEAATPLIASSPIADCLVMSFFTFVPVYATYYHECHTKINREIVLETQESREKKIQFKKPFAIGQAVSYLGMLAAVVVASLLPFFQFEMLWIIIAAGLFGAAIILPLGVELLIQRKQFNFVKYLLNVFVPYFAVGVVLIGLALGVQIAVNASYLIQVSIPTGISLFYIGLFAVVPYLGHRTGAVLSAFDVITRTNERLFAKRLRTSDRPDRLTLYEKWTKYITPKCFRNDL